MDVPTIRIDGDLDPAAVRGLVDRLAPALAGLLPNRRWFGDKDRPIAAVAAADAVVDGFGETVFAWAPLDVSFVDGGRAGYALPLAVADAGTTEGPRLAVLDHPDRPRDLLEATDHPAFADWLLDTLSSGRSLPGERGRLVFSPFPGLAARLDGARRGPAKVGGVEQSNTAVRYGEAMLLKLFRRLVPGVNLDEALTRFLVERAGFGHVPPPLGAISWAPANGDRAPAALAQAFVPNLGDGWGWVLARLGEGTAAARAEVAGAAGLLGRRTAEMHRALASAPDDPFFAPEPAAPAALAAQAAAARGALAATLAALRERRSGAGGDGSAVIDRVLAAGPMLAETLAGFAAETGLPRLRVHGDYHLGQVLRTPDGDWSILDFEGEPARPLAERLEKTSPLKDAAGMLRSLGYARGAAVLAGADPAVLASWEERARTAFLDGYRSAIAGADPPLVPVDPAAFAAALAAWELDKALYEIRYELGNRPDWLPIPLAALARLA